MRAHKTFSGMAKAVERLIEELDGEVIDSQESADRWDKRVNPLLRELASAWTNQAQADEAAILKNRLSDAADAAMCRSATSEA